MSHADNSHHLKRAAAARHESAVTRARKAIETLDHDGTAITFTAVAVAAGVSRSWLYTNDDLRHTITTLRQTPTATTSTPTPAAQRATTNSLRERLDNARDEITRLRAENATLHTQLARSLGDQRQRP